jgi:branched-chain amino acid transport system ATP-binding protein
MVLRLSHRAFALATGSVALRGDSAELLPDERINSLNLGDEIY